MKYYLKDYITDKDRIEGKDRENKEFYHYPGSPREPPNEEIPDYVKRRMEQIPKAARILVELKRKRASLDWEESSYLEEVLKEQWELSSVQSVKRTIFQLEDPSEFVIYSSCESKWCRGGKSTREVLQQRMSDYMVALGFEKSEIKNMFRKMTKIEPKFMYVPSQLDE